MRQKRPVTRYAMVKSVESENMKMECAVQSWKRVGCYHIPWQRKRQR